MADSLTGCSGGSSSGVSRLVSTVDKKKFVDTADASTTAPLTEAALSSLDGESTFLSTDQLRAQQEAASSGDDLSTQHTKTCSGRSSQARGPKRKAKRLDDMKRRVEATGGIWVSQEKHRRNGITVIDSNTGKLMKGSMAEECQNSIVEQANAGE